VGCCFMGKLQCIRRSNGTCVFLVYIPVEAVERACLVKGDELFFEVKGVRRIEFHG